MLQIQINHEAWIEPQGDKLLVRWGHYPEVDGRIDPHVIREVMVIGDDVYNPIVFVHKKDALRLAWPGGEAKFAFLHYTRGPFTKTRNEWIYGDKCSTERVFGEANESLIIEGFAVYSRSLESLIDEVLPKSLQPELIVKGDSLLVKHENARVWCNGAESGSRACKEKPVYILIKLDKVASMPCVDKVRWIASIYLESF